MCFLSSRTRDWTHIPSTARWILNHWTTKEVPELFFLKQNFILVLSSNHFHFCLTLIYNSQIEFGLGLWTWSEVMTTESKGISVIGSVIFRFLTKFLQIKKKKKELKWRIITFGKTALSQLSVNFKAHVSSATVCIMDSLNWLHSLCHLVNMWDLKSLKPGIIVLCF